MKVLIAQEVIRERVREIGSLISKEYDGKDLVVVGVLKGAFVFMADLIRAISVPLHCEFLHVSSYEKNRSTGNVRIDFDLTQSVAGKHVLLVEDIVDTGRTLRFLLDHLKSKKPASVTVCSLLYKEIDPAIRPLIDYLGFTIPKEYVVGYGMDDGGMLRSLPDIRIVQKGPA
ncbi:MAG TPA: hypoxanthine phosphoribosyltransferase [bacterium]|nr:hypoxanthine phosphoribosyltransferase [bacterium]